MFPTTCATTASLSEPARVGDRRTMPARNPSVGGIPSRAIGLPGTRFVTLGVSSAGPLGPNSYHPSPKVVNIIARSQIALERMPPTDGLLAGIVCLSPALGYSLRDAIVAHVVRNMENEGLNI